MATAMFRENLKFNISTGGNGAGWIALLPQDTCGFSVIGASPGAVAGWDGNPNSEARPFYCYAESSSIRIPTNYAQARLVGAAMSVEYIGQLEACSGYMQAAHIHDSSPLRVSEDLIEDGYFFYHDNPLHGCRVVYAPKDDSDLEFADTNQRMNVTNQANANMIDVNEY